MKENTVEQNSEKLIELNSVPQGWKYYNHAVIPETAPHENVDTRPLKNGLVWNRKGVLFARWTTDFDCGYETDWWYCIKKSPYIYDDLSRKSRKHIRQSLKKCTVRKLDLSTEKEDVWNVFKSAVDSYEGNLISASKTSFLMSLKKSKEEWWGAFNDDKKLVGWMSCRVHENWVDTVSAKFDPEYIKLGASAALYHTILTEYLNVRGKKYISGGERSINHQTNTQQYKIEKINYEKVYCKLNIEYNPKIKWLIKMIYPFKRFLKCLDNIRLIHQLNALLKMESIVRGQNRK